ncbi:hypothetical protein ABIB48_001705 [Arthrobacter sp. UYCu511]|uniref:DUF4352 domain-containing protein n=1 Tax=Arthrobacter sp. UYCu511 TaxID=3156337 RepID=UPI0033956AF0
MSYFGANRLAPVALTVLVAFSAVLFTGCTSTTAADPAPLAGSTAGASAASTAVPTAAPTAASPAQPVATPSVAPGRSKPVPAPSGGSILQKVPAVSPGPVTKVELNKTAALPDKVSITVSKAEALETKATTPGEIAGPAVAMFVSIRNGSLKSISVDSAIVTLSNASGVLGQPTTSDPYLPFSGELAPGASTQGVYVFLIPTNARTGLSLSVEYAAGQASAQFVGSVS